jgi:hypothetical protein
MRKIKAGTLKTRSIEMKSRLMYMYGAVFLKLLYKSMLGKVTRSNRPLFTALVVNLFLCYYKWTIASESVDELTGIRILELVSEITSFPSFWQAVKKRFVHNSTIIINPINILFFLNIVFLLLSYF